VLRLRGHFDGHTIVLDESPPPELKPNTPVEIVIPDGTREQALRELNNYLDALWAKANPSSSQTSSRRWKREELYERGGKPLA
jgi:hypothetical protein